MHRCKFTQSSQQLKLCTTLQLDLIISQVDVNVRKDEIIYLKLWISNLKHFHWLTKHTLSVHIPAQPASAIK